MTELAIVSQHNRQNRSGCYIEEMQLVDRGHGGGVLPRPSSENKTAISAVHHNRVLALFFAEHEQLSRHRLL